MSALLERLGRLAHRRPWPFVVAWTVVLGVVLWAAATNGAGAISSSVSIDGTRSQAVLDDLRADLPMAAGSQGMLVVVAPDGERLDQGPRAAAITHVVRDVTSLETVVERPVVPQPGARPTDGMTLPEGMELPEGVELAEDGTIPEGMEIPEELLAQLPAPPPPPANGSGPLEVDGAQIPGVLVAGDGSMAIIEIQLTEQIDDLADGALAEVIDTAEAAVADTDLTVLAGESLQPMHPPVGGHEAIGIGVAALVLVLTLGSLVAAGLPLLTALTGVGIGLGGAVALSDHITMTSATPVLALMIGLAVGIDYALFIVNRQRQLILTEQMTAEDAAARSVGTAGSAVLFAGLTVIVALSALSIINISFLTTMALVAAATVLCAVLIAITLLPALLGLVGERVVSRRARARGVRLPRGGGHRLARRWSTLVVARPWLVVIGVVAFLGLAAWPATDLSLGMPSGSTANVDTAERQAYDAVSDGLGEGYNGPLVVVARPLSPGEVLDQRDLVETATLLRDVPDVVDVQMMGATPDLTTALFKVVPADGPLADSTADLVHTLREPGYGSPAGKGVDFGITGVTAVNIDISAKLLEVLPIYIAIIVVISLAILTLVFRSLWIPVKATAGFLLSVLATFGLATAVFEWGWLRDVVGFDTTGPLLSFLPIMVTGILYGLAMDYEVFLVTSMRQSHVRGLGDREAVVDGFVHASRVVVAAAVIMVSVFAGFILTDDPTIKQFGFALAVGILLDAFLVRLTLGPALMVLLGRRVWTLPGWLDRLLPDLDIEGERLSQPQREAPAPVSVPAGSSG